MATSLRIDRDTLLRRRDLAQALTDNGYPTAPATLASWATRGGGPPYRMWGRIPLYCWGDALAWAERRLTEPRSSSSEADFRSGAAEPQVASPP
jgi:hypothetical protein